MDENDKKLKKLEDLLRMIDESLTKEEFEKSFEKVLDIVKSVKEKNKEELELMRISIAEESEKTKKETEEYIETIKGRANEYFAELFEAADKKLSAIKKSVRSGVDGAPGKDADEGRVIDSVLVKVLDKVPTVENIINQFPKLGERFRDGLELLTGDERLDKSAIRGIEELEKLIIEKNQNGGRGWGAHPLVIQDDGDIVDKVARILNFKGTAITSIERLPDGTVEITIDGGGGPGGDGLSKETPVGVVDDSNTTFTVDNEPFFININGAIYEEGDGGYASYAAGTITLAFPVGVGGFIKSYY